MKTAAAVLLDACKEHGWTLGAAESLTGGLLSSTLVAVPGASEVFRGSVVSYAVDVKASVLGVSEEQLAQTGPVDGEVALQMAAGAARVLNVDVALSTTGVAGPGPADGHPAGTVYVAVQTPSGTHCELLQLHGEREDIRQQTVQKLLGIAAETVLTPACF